MNLDGNQAAQDWASGLAARTGKMQASAQAVTVAPGQLAARQKNAYLAGVQAKVETWARNVGKVSLGDWQTAYITKGIPRIATGAQAAVPKMASFLNDFLPFVDRARQQLPARGTYEQNKARMNAMVDAIHAYQRKA